MSGEAKVRGPDSCFPSIEKKCGFPIGFYEVQEKRKHMEMVHWLKSEHGIGHGHVNALVACFHGKQDRQAAW